jgi:hypothetical protein
MRMLSTITKIVGQPFVRFLFLGAVFYGLYTLIGAPGPEDADRVIRVTTADISRLDAAWRARWNRPPTQEELTGLVKASIQEEALYRHAVAMGLDKNDVVVRRMLGQKLQTLAQNLLELSLSPTEQELMTYFDANSQRYQPPDLITFTQLFLNPDQRGDRTLEDAEEILTRLRTLPEPTEGIDGLGDSFMLQRYYPSKTQLDISKQFGQGFMQSVFELSPGEWHGPVLSGYGVHLVYVHYLEEHPLPELDAVRDRVKEDWLDEKRREFQDAYIEEILTSYEVIIDETSSEAPDTTPVGSGQEASR